ncbi:MAG TPA: hypothetical protein VGO07_00405, partial [Candidatus Saccharimonadales bacterium]|nr:hypothetical protein [Candidatus Saccharimonadales bacterium]
MARQDEFYDLGYLDDLRAARDADPGVMPGDLATNPAEQADDLRRDFAQAPHSGLEMAGPYVQSFYGDDYAPDASLPRWLGNATDDHVLHFQRLHADVRDGLQGSPAVQRAFQAEQRHFLDGIGRGISDG